MAAAAMLPTLVMSTNAIYSWHLFIDLYKFDARDNRVDWLYNTFAFLLRDDIFLLEGL